MNFILFFLLLFLPLSGFCSSTPRLLITLGPKCDFTPHKLQKVVGAAIIEDGSIREIKDKIKELDRSSDNHLIIILKEFEDFEEFANDVCYAPLYLNTKYKKALKILYNTMSSLPLTDSYLPRLDPIKVGLFYHLLKQVDHIFKKNNLVYWGTCGTVLGAIRHQGMIPWDDDIDLAIFEKDVPILLGLKEFFDEAGLEMCYQSKWEIYKIFSKDGIPIIDEYGQAYPWKFPFIDILPLKEIDGKFTYTNKEWQHWFAHDFYYPEDIQTFQEIAFGPLLIPVALQPLDYINRMYGEDWNEVTYISYWHEKEIYLNKIRVDLYDRSPAEYRLPENFYD